MSSLNFKSYIKSIINEIDFNKAEYNYKKKKYAGIKHRKNYWNILIAIILFPLIILFMIKENFKNYM